MNRLTIAISVMGLLLLCGCPPPAKEGSSATDQPGSNEVETGRTEKLHVALLASDMGLGDGWNVRQLDGLLEGREAAGGIEYTLVGELPREIAFGEIGADVGFPDPESEIPGSMTELQGAALLDEAPQCDWLVLSSGYLLQHALEKVAAGSLDVGAIIVAEECGSQDVQLEGSVPVYIMRFDICHAAFMAGAVAARSNNVAHFMLFGAEDDPQVDDFMRAAVAGLQYVSPSAWVKQAVMPVDSRGMVLPDTFRDTHVELLSDAGENFNTNHYILDLTRSNAYVMSLIADPAGPLNGYASAGYQDLRHLAESRILTIGLKKPEVALAWMLDHAGEDGDLSQYTEENRIMFGLPGSLPGLEESAVGYTDLDLYSRFNYDGPEIGEDMATWWSEIVSGEIGINYCPH